MQIITPSVSQVIFMKKFLCHEGKNPFKVLVASRISSVIHTAFYPGPYPFKAGGIAKTAGAL